MSDKNPRTVISDMLYDRLVDFGFDDRYLAQKIVETLLTVPGISVVELPKFDPDYGCFIGGGYPCNGDPEKMTGCPGGMVRTSMNANHLSPHTARSYAAALLAAADAAEAK